MSHQMRFINLAILGLVAVGTMTPAARADFLYVARDSALARIDTTTKVETTIYSGPLVFQAFGLAVDTAGTAYVSSFGTNTIERITAGGVASVFASTGLDGPQGLAIDAAGNVYAANYGTNTIERFTPGGVGTVFASTGLLRPYGLAIDATGNLYAGNADGTIERFTPGGVGTVFATGLSGAAALAFDSAGNLYAGLGLPSQILRFTPAGVGSVFTNNGVGIPTGLAVDRAGNVYNASEANNFIQVFTPGGVGSLFNSGGPGGRPTALAFQASLTSAVPEPSSLAMLGVGLVGVAGYLRRREAR